MLFQLQFFILKQFELNGAKEGQLSVNGHD
jgi:hypothetical protein